ncbi:MAG: SagB/ThcOx family dehydrogenase [Desulfurococcaceae archaeon]
MGRLGRGAIPLIAGLAISTAIIAYVVSIIYATPAPSPAVFAGPVIYLPLPSKVTNVTVEEAILLRRSIREYANEPVRLEDLAMILWAAYGITDSRGFRASPSAGATYPLEIYVVIGEGGVRAGGSSMAPGVYHYEPERHALTLMKEGDLRRQLEEAALGQEWVGRAPLTIVIAAVFERTTRVYGERGAVRYVPMEVGHAGQNVYLMATALGYGTVAVGAFDDEAVSKIVGLKPGEVPMYLMPVGVPASKRQATFEEIWKYIEGARK